MSHHRHHDPLRLGQLSRSLGLLAAVSLATLAACGRAPGPPAPGPSPAPVQRIVSLAPHLAELSYAAGAGDRLVGTVVFSDQPTAARQLPRIGDAFRLDYEAVAALRPDLILGWPSGNSPATLERLESLGYRVVALEPRTLEDISNHLRTIGDLAGTAAVAGPAATAFEQRLAALRSAHQGSRPVTVFFQIAPEPLITVGARHFISQVLEACGGRNVFGHLDTGAVTVGREDVLAAAPEVIVANDFTAGTPGTGGRSPLEAWRAWRQVPAVSLGLLYLADPDLMSVPGPRLLDGATQICRNLEDARRKLPVPPGRAGGPAGAGQGS